MGDAGSTDCLAAHQALSPVDDARVPSFRVDCVRVRLYPAVANSVLTFANFGYDLVYGDLGTGVAIRPRFVAR